MANKQLFKTTVGRAVPATDTTNRAGGTAYAFTPEHALAQLAVTGTLNDTFYADAQAQLAEVVATAAKVSPEFLAKTAVYAREKGFMKDMPALLTAVLATRDSQLLSKIFDRVIDNPKMLRNFVQIMRSGQVGRKSLGTRPKKLVQAWFDKRTDEQIFRADVGQDPSLSDIIAMVHPAPKTDERRALYGYLREAQDKFEAEKAGRKFNPSKPFYDPEKLPPLVKQFEQWKKDRSVEMPDLPFRMLDSAQLTKADWIKIAKSANWTTTRMNLNTFARHGVFEDKDMVELVASKLRDEKAVERARVFPYQLLSAYLNTEGQVPAAVRDALQDAMEVATRNVPAFEGDVIVAIDVSGSMASPVTGHRAGATSKVNCVQVAGLIGSTVLRKAPNARVIVFNNSAKEVTLNSRDSVMTNASKIAEMLSGGTNTSSAIALANAKKMTADLFWLVSDNQSWIETLTGQYSYTQQGTGAMQEWERFRARNPKAKLVCLDLQPYTNSQVKDRRREVLNIGGFSDEVFEIVNLFLKDQLDARAWVGAIEKVAL